MLMQLSQQLVGIEQGLGMFDWRLVQTLAQFLARIAGR
jgi:hypothetical protein